LIGKFYTFDRQTGYILPPQPQAFEDAPLEAAPEAATADDNLEANEGEPPAEDEAVQPTEDTLIDDTQTEVLHSVTFQQ
jgi:hypothetical protein